MIRQGYVLLAVLALLSGCAPKSLIREEPAVPPVRKPTIQERAKSFAEAFSSRKLPFAIPPEAKIDTLQIDTLAKSVLIRLNDRFAGLPFRDETVSAIYDSVRDFFGSDFKSYAYHIEAMRLPLEQLVPNYFRSDSSRFDRSRLSVAAGERGAPVVRNVSKQFAPTEGLFNRNIVVWPSHGWYYNNESDRWEWQRPRLFQSVEDLIPLSFVLPYVVPMLENAGANVFVPRERDTQTNEVIVGNDRPVEKGQRRYRESATKRHFRWKKGVSVGYAYGKPPYPGNFNPFHAGGHRTVISDTAGSATVSWVPGIPEAGWYSVYVTYVASDSNVSDESYTVYHEGG